MGKLGKVYHSVDEVRNDREEIAKKFSDDIPNYLTDFFDFKEQQQLNAEFYKERSRLLRGIPRDDRREFAKAKTEDFWENNKGRIRKKQKRLGSHLEAVYIEPDRNIDAFDQEHGLTPVEKEALKNLCEDDIYLFACRYFKHLLKKPSSEFHIYLYRFLNDKLNQKNRKKGFKKAIAAPRGNAKSTVVSCILPLWCVCYKKKNFIMLISDTASQAEDFLTDVKRELEGNILLQRDFPSACVKGSTWRQDEVMTGNGIKVMALGTGSKIRGRKIGASRPDLAIFDDLESSDMVRSKTTREFIRYQWFDKDAMQVGGRGEVIDFLVVGTILGSASLLQALLDVDQYPDWQSIKFKAVKKFSHSDLWPEWEKLYINRFDLDRQKTALAFFEDNKEEMLKGTSILWPDGDSYYDLMVIKLSNPSGFLSEYQNEPLDLTKVLVVEGDLHQLWFNTPAVQKILRGRDIYYYGAIDPSLGKTATSDYTCIVSLAKSVKTGYLYVIDIYLKRVSPEKQIDDILNKYADYNYMRFGIETNAFQIVLSDALRKESRRVGALIPIEELKNYSDKVMRIESIVPLIKDGTIIFDKNKRSNTQQYALGVEMLLSFTSNNTHSYDDFPDALEMAIRIARTKGYRLLTKQNR